MRTTLKLFCGIALLVLPVACEGRLTGDDTARAPESPLEAASGESGAARGCQAGTYKIAYQGPLSGQFASLGKDMLAGVRFAVDRANEARLAGVGARLDVQPLDSQGSGDQAPPLASQAAGDAEVIAVVGPTLWHETQVSGPTFEEAQLPFVTPSATTPGKSEAAWRFFFRLVGSGSAQARAAAAFIAEHLEASTVAVIDDSSPEYGKPLADVVAEALGQYDVAVVHRASLVPGRDDYSTEVANIVNSEAEAVFFGGYSREAGLVKRQLVATGGSSIPFISGDAVFDAQYLETAGPENADSTYVTFPGVDPSSAAPEFIQAYRDEYGVQPGPFTLEAHDAARLIIEGLRWGACDRSAMRSFLASYNGEIRGRDISFDEMGNLEDPRFTVYAVAGGTWTLEVQRQPASLPGPPIASTTSPERSP